MVWGALRPNCSQKFIMRVLEFSLWVESGRKLEFPEMLGMLRGSVVLKSIPMAMAGLVTSIDWTLSMNCVISLCMMLYLHSASSEHMSSSAWPEMYIVSPRRMPAE